MNDIADRFQKQLSSGERLLWVGQPKVGFRFVPMDLYLLPFGLLFGGIGCWGLTEVVRGGLCPQLMWAGAAGVPGIVGFYILVGRFLWDMWKLSTTFYAVTDRRAMILSTPFFTQCDYLDWRSFPWIQFQPGKNGRGRVIFGDAPIWLEMPVGWSYRSMRPVRAFEQLENAYEVYRLILKVQAGDPVGAVDENLPESDWIMEEWPQSELLPGERLLWQGRPDLGLLGVTRATRGVLFFPAAGILLFGCMSLLFLRAEEKIPPFGPFGIFIGVLLAIGVGMLLADQWGRQHTFYALTDRRALIQVRGWVRRLQSVSLLLVPERSLRSGRQGRGTILWGKLAPWFQTSFPWSYRDVAVDPPAFEGIEDVAEVYRLVK